MRKNLKASAILIFVLMQTVVLANEHQIAFGINYNSFGACPWAPWANCPPDVLSSVRETGIQSVRVWVRWDQIEENQNTYNWIYSDSLVDNAEKEGFQILAVFSDIPTWISSEDPSFISEYTDFVSATVSRYRGRISYYSPLNEPNCCETNRQLVNPESYIPILEACYNVVRTIDPDAMIYGPETFGADVGAWFEPIITYDPTPPANNICDPSVCDVPNPNPELCNPYICDSNQPSGDEACLLFDVFAAHIYPPGINQNQSYVGATIAVFDQAAEYINRIKLASPCYEKPFWITEYSVPSWDPHDGGYGIGEDDQADEYEQAYRWTIELDQLERLYIFRVTDNTPGYREWGILKNLWSVDPRPADPYPPKAAYWRIQNLIDDIRSQRTIEVDATVPDLFIVKGGSGSIYTSGAVDTGPDNYTDQKWSAVNNYRGVGVNVLVSHANYEDSLWAGLHVTGLQNGAIYDVSIRYLTIPNHADLRGIRAKFPESEQFMEFDQNFAEALVIRELHDGEYEWEEWQVYLGKAMVENGEIVVYLDDKGGLIDLYEANVTGLVLQSALFRPKQILFKDDFESGNASNWASMIE